MPRLSLPLTGESPEQIARYEGDILQDVFRIGTIKKAEEITGGLSQTTKMPEFSYDIPATRCRLGSILATRENTVCSDCYALKNWYRVKNVKDALEVRYRALSHADWVPGLVLILQKRKVKHFRWHSSGDLQSAEHLLNIDAVARHTPDTEHWLPTREAEIVKRALKILGQFAPNLRIRISAQLVDGPPPSWWETTSTVFTEEPREGSFRCPAADQGGMCGDCRACWSDARDIAYPKH